MPDYKRLYKKVFNKVTDVIEELQQLQLDTEELYIKMCEEEEQTKKVSNDTKIVSFEDLKKYQKISKKLLTFKDNCSKMFRRDKDIR